MLSKKPTHDRTWSPDQAVLPHGDFLDDSHVRLHSIRDVMYRTRSDFDVSYYDAEYDLQTVASVWFLLAPFGPPGIAHTLMSFRFRDGRALALSIEVRRRKGETFSLWRMFPRAYELMYVFADERDVVRLRAAIWKGTTYFFPLRITGECARVVARDAIMRANSIFVHPEFYHPTANNCTNNLISHMRAAGITMPRVSWRYLFPTAILSLFSMHGLLPVGETPASIKKKYRVIPHFAEFADSVAFSARVRGELA